jgi:hypothetical protein
MEQNRLLVDEADARRLLLARAVDEEDAQGRLVGQPERERIEQEALEASRGPAPDDRLDRGRYLRERAQRVVTVATLRQRNLATLLQAQPWRQLLAWGLPIAACVTGAALDRIDNPQQVNMLSPPLLGVLLWNLGAYLLLAAAAVLPGRWHAWLPVARIQQAFAVLAQRPGGRLRDSVAGRFRQLWLSTAGAQELLWWKQLLHFTAAGWAVGLALSIALGGLVRQYRIGWESTLLDLGQVHGFLRFLFAPVVALPWFEPFSAQELARLAFASGAPIGVDEARRWVWMYLALLVLVVVLPRTLLALWAAWRRQRLARAVAIDLAHPYYAQALARVSPAHVLLAWQAGDEAGRATVLRLVQQMAGRGEEDAAGTWLLAATSRGDALRLAAVPEGFVPPATPAPTEAGPSATQRWLSELATRFRHAPPGERQGHAGVALHDADLVLLVPAQPADLERATPLLRWLAQPALVLVRAGEDPARWRDTVHQLGLAADVLAIDQAIGNWTRDPALLAAIAARLPSAKRGGFGRLASAWTEHNERRFAQALRVLARLLLACARDVEAESESASALRQLVDPAQREAALKARQGAMDAVLARLRAAHTAALAELLQLHGMSAGALPLADARLGEGFLVHARVDAQQAGLAGAASGAALGASLDMVTGGLTLGAAAALGAVIGGGASFAAAAWKNRGGPAQPTQVQLGNEMLQTLTEAALLGYLAIAQRDAGPGFDAPARWRSEVVAAVEARRDALAAVWARARAGEGEGELLEPLRLELDGMARGVLARAG